MSHMNINLISIGPHVVNVGHLLYGHTLIYRGKEGEVKKRTFKLIFSAGESLEIAEAYIPEAVEALRSFVTYPVEQEQPAPARS